jgi:hypothetical protein
MISEHPLDNYNSTEFETPKFCGRSCGVVMRKLYNYFHHHNGILRANTNS